MKQLLLSLFLFSALLALSLSAAAGTHYYVDNTNPSASNGNLGTNPALPWLTIGKAAATLGAGDMVTVGPGGSYDEAVVPRQSGTSGAAITYIAGVGAKPKVRRFDLTGISYITVRGFEVTNVGFSADTNPSFYATGSTGVQILDNYIHDTTNFTATIRAGSSKSKSHNLHIAGNIITNSGALGSRSHILELWGDDMLIENNNLSHGRDFSDIFGNRIVIRNNDLHDAHNAESNGQAHLDGMQSFCNHGTPNESVNYLLMEGNYYHDNPDADEHFGLVNGTEACGGSTTVILRENILYNFGEAAYISDLNHSFADHHKYYNNTSVNGGVAYSPKPHVSLGLNGVSYGSVLNNIFVDVISPNPPAELYVLDRSGTSAGDYNLAYMTTGSINWSGPISSEQHHILNQNPLFVGGVDFHLQSRSPARNAGGRLTTVHASDSGSGNALIVGDAHFFQDGWAGVSPDWIAVGNTSNAIQISSINYATNTITLVRPIARSPGQSVWLYKNSAGETVLHSAGPDIGAFAFSETGGLLPR